jgi:galactose mutarotase-like enzyme
MALKTWTITDRDHDIALEALELGANDLPSGCRLRKRTLRGGRSEGVDVIEISNGRLDVAILPTRGMGLWRASLGDLRLGWRSPVRGPVNPAFVNLWEPSGLGWLSGFDELLCRCGLESNGGPVHDEAGRLIYPLHGKVANLPAHHVHFAVDRQSGELMVEGVVDEARLYGQKLRLTSTVRARQGEPALSITDVVRNLSAEPAELQLLYHVNFGEPLLEPGARVVAPLRTLVPQTARAAEGIAHWDTYADGQPGFEEQVYFLDLLADGDGATEALLRNAHGNHGVSLRFNKRQLPYFTVWKSTQAAADGYVTGLEPAINLPNTRDFEASQGRVARLAPGEARTFELRIEAHADAEGVHLAEQRIARLQGGRPSKIFDTPQVGWSASTG